MYFEYPLVPWVLKDTLCPATVNPSVCRVLFTALHDSCGCVPSGDEGHLPKVTGPLDVRLRLIRS